MKFKKNLCLYLVIVMVISFASCGVSREEFISAVEAYKIFDEPFGVAEMETVSDFIAEMESFDGENENFITFVDASWSTEELTEDDEFITGLREETDFVYDDDKYYGELRVNITVASKKDNATLENCTYYYLFSLKDGVVTAEATATSPEDAEFDYEDFAVGKTAVKDNMGVWWVLGSVMHETYK